MMNDQNTRKSVNDRIRDIARATWERSQAVPSPDIHARLWAEHREAVLRSWWAMRTAGHIDTIVIIIDGAVTVDGSAVSEVPRIADAARVLSRIRPELLCGLPAKTIFSEALRTNPTARRILVISGAPGAGLDYIVQDDPLVSGAAGTC